MDETSALCIFSLPYSSANFCFAFSIINILSVVLMANVYVYICCLFFPADCHDLCLSKIYFSPYSRFCCWFVSQYSVNHLHYRNVLKGGKISGLFITRTTVNNLGYADDCVASRRPRQLIEYGDTNFRIPILKYFHSWLERWNKKSKIQNESEFSNMISHRWPDVSLSFDKTTHWLERWLFSQ